MSTLRAYKKGVLRESTIKRIELEKKMLAEAGIEHRLEEYEALRLFKNVPSVIEIAAKFDPRNFEAALERERATKRAARARAMRKAA